MHTTDSRFANVPEDPVARRLRSRRLAAGLSLRELVDRASSWLKSQPSDGLGRRSVTVSAPYLSLIENGRKVPDLAVALALAAALDDDPALYEAWVRARKRTDFESALAAAETLKRLLAPPPEPTREERAGATPLETPAARLGATAARPSASTASRDSRHTRLRVPIVPAGADPGENLRPACEVLEWRRLDASALSEDDHARLDRPFAIRLAAEFVGRVRDRFVPGDHALVLRAFGPLEIGAIYAVRHAGRVILSRVLWNRGQLLLLPAEGESDFLVLEAGDEARLRSAIVGAVVAVRFEPEDATPMIAESPA